MHLTTHKTLKYRRTTGLLMVLMLAFNMVLPVVFASVDSEGQYTWLCTSQGLVKIALENTDSNPDQVPDVANAGHCPYCKLFDHAIDVSNTDLVSLRPVAHKQSLYRTPEWLSDTSTTLTIRPLRAPPLLS